MNYFLSICQFRFYKPLNNGQSWPMAPIGPRPVYCPTANSINNIGTPQTNNIIKYGIRNIPVKKMLIFEMGSVCGKSQTTNYLHHFYNTNMEIAIHFLNQLNSQHRLKQIAFYSTIAGVWVLNGRHRIHRRQSFHRDHRIPVN